jgi:hypothetical protein
MTGKTPGFEVFFQPALAIDVDGMAFAHPVQIMFWRKQLSRADAQRAECSYICPPFAAFRRKHS